jgi:hypothetical protein
MNPTGFADALRDLPPALISPARAFLDTSHQQVAATFRHDATMRQAGDR